MRLLLPFALLLTGCGPGLVFNMTPEMTKDQMLARADHIFIGVIEKQEFENWLFLQVPGAKRSDWTILKRQVRVETVLRGQEPRQSVTVYEYFPNGGLSFLLRVENGRYHLVRDFWRSIFRIYSGKHARLPLHDGRPLWERIGLLTWWPGEDAGFGDSNRMDPDQALGRWRAAKLARGFVRNPDHGIRVFGCQALVYLGPLQDECWEQISSEDRSTWSAHGLAAADQFLGQRRNPDRAIMGFWGRGVEENDIDT